MNHYHNDPANKNVNYTELSDIICDTIKFCVTQPLLEMAKDLANDSYQYADLKDGHKLFNNGENGCAVMKNIHVGTEHELTLRIFFFKEKVYRILVTRKRNNSVVMTVTIGKKEVKFNDDWYALETIREKTFFLDTTMIYPYNSHEIANTLFDTGSLGE